MTTWWWVCVVAVATATAFAAGYRAGRSRTCRAILEILLG